MGYPRGAGLSPRILKWGIMEFFAWADPVSELAHRAAEKLSVLTRIFHKYLGSFQTVEFVRANLASIEVVLIFSMGRM